MNPVSPYRKGTTTMHQHLKDHLQVSPPGRMLIAISDTLTGVHGHDPADVFVSYNSRNPHPDGRPRERVQVTVLEWSDEIHDAGEEDGAEYGDYGHCGEDCDEECDPSLVQTSPTSWRFRHRRSHTLTFDTEIARAWVYDTAEAQQPITTNTDPLHDYSPELTARYAGEIAQFLHDKATGGQS